MDFKTFMSRLEEVRYVGKVENGYSHIIYELLYEDVLDTEKYMLVDVSSMDRWSKVRATGEQRAINTELLGENLCAVPDFVITNRPNFDTTKKKDLLKEIERLGCIEMKFYNRDVNADRLSDKGKERGYLSTYNKHVIYTNGWKWSYYDGRKNDDGSYKDWLNVDFNDKKQRNQEKYDELLAFLREIVWEQ